MPKPLTREEHEKLAPAFHHIRSSASSLVISTSAAFVKQSKAVQCTWNLLHQLEKLRAMLDERYFELTRIEPSPYYGPDPSGKPPRDDPFFIAEHCGGCADLITNRFGSASPEGILARRIGATLDDLVAVFLAGAGTRKRRCS